MTDFLTAGIEGSGGLLKEAPEDFLVEELPLYTPCGEGEHLYLLVEKQGLSTFELMRQLGRALGVREREMGYAGLKDARATTRQTISIPGIGPDQALALTLPGVTILEARRHRNKLRPGHLAGNRFTIRLRRVAPGAGDRARAVLGTLEARGVPNLFGEQRYGALGNSHRIGRAILRRDFDGALREVMGDPGAIRDERWREGATRFAAGDLAGALAVLPGRMRDERAMIQTLLEGKPAEAALRRLPRPMLRLFLSAFQSSLFDRQVAARLHALGELRTGDLACKHENGACFLVTDPGLEQPRADRFEISPTGALFGSRMTPAQGETGRLEGELLEGEGLIPEDFNLGGGLAMEGERRPLRVPLTGGEIREEGEDLNLGFSLPRGSYATSVLREIMKVDTLAGRALAPQTEGGSDE